VPKILKKLGKFISRMAGAKPKNGESREFFTLEGREMGNEKTALLETADSLTLKIQIEPGAGFADAKPVTSTTLQNSEYQNSNDEASERGLFIFLGKNTKQQDNNQNNPAKDIDGNHIVRKVGHNYNDFSLANNKLPNQDIIDNTRPLITAHQLSLSEKNGPRNTVAKNIWPISEDMSESLETRDSENVSSENFINVSKQHNHSIRKNDLSNVDPALSDFDGELSRTADRPACATADRPSDGEDENGSAAQRTGNLGSGASNIGESKLAEACPYCNSKNFVKRGTRKNKRQVVQLYLCKNAECGKTFTAQDVKGKHFPLNVIIEGMSYYNLGFTLEQSCSFIKQKFNIRPEPETLSEWISQYSQLCRYERLRPFAVKMFAPKDMVEVVTMAHRQLYRFRYHRAKTRLMLEEEYRNRRLLPLKEFLDNISSVTPHQYFQEGERMSEIRSKFDKADMLIKSKFNYANRLAAFVLQAVKENKQRHEQLQRFLIANDSCTVATEVPVYIRKEDVEHMENELKFKISERPGPEVAHRIEPSSSLGLITLKGSNKPVPFPRLLTGHIDIVQIRNGQVHLLDYKPNAAKEKPVEQLTWYALAMARLTGLRLYDFTCAWFDEKDFFQFYPLHVVKKLKGASKKRRKIFFKDGTWGEVPKKDELKVV